MFTEAHIYARFTVQVEGDLSKEDIKKAFDSKASGMLNGGKVLTLSGEANLVVDESEIYNTEKKYIYRELKTRDGEREYYHKGVHEIGADVTPLDFVNNLAANFWEEDMEEEDGGYYHISGEVFVQAYKAEEISKAEYENLKKFL